MVSYYVRHFSTFYAFQPGGRIVLSFFLRSPLVKVVPHKIYDLYETLPEWLIYTFVTFHPFKYFPFLIFSNFCFPNDFTHLSTNGIDIHYTNVIVDIVLHVQTLCTNYNRATVFYAVSLVILVSSWLVRIQTWASPLLKERASHTPPIVTWQSRKPPHL